MEKNCMKNNVLYLYISKDVYTCWLKQGTIGFEKHIDRCLDLSEYLYTKIKNREGYEMVFHGQVCEEYF